MINATFEEGKEAFNVKQPLRANPYHHSTTEWRLWYSGWMRGYYSEEIVYGE